MRSFNDFVHKCKLKFKATSNIKFSEVLSSIGLDIVGIYLRDGLFSSDVGIVNLHPSKGTHWVTYMNKPFFDSYGCSPPQKVSRFIIKRNGHCFDSEYKIQGLTIEKDSFCASYVGASKILLDKSLRNRFRFCCFEVILPNDTKTLTFSFKQMTLRKKTIDNSVKYILSMNRSRSETSHDHKPKTVSNPRK